MTNHNAAIEQALKKETDLYWERGFDLQKRKAILRELVETVVADALEHEANRPRKWGEGVT